MKKLFLFAIFSIGAMASFAQKKIPQTKQEKITAKYQTERAKADARYTQQINKANEQSVKRAEKDLNHDMGMPPKKVRTAFSREYPQATNISWAKSRGNYIVSFTNGIRRQTATYRPDGKRVYTRRVM